MPEQLTEHVADWRSAVVVEKGSRTIRNVALAGAESKNGYRYAEAALKAAARLYEEVPVFLDHPMSPHRPRDRSARDLAGSVSNVRYEAGRLRGDLRTLDTEAGRTLLALAEADGPGVGMSHVVLAERSGDGATVERIVEVVSVDAVAFPATTRTFRESAGSDPPVADPAPLSLGRGEGGEGASCGDFSLCAASFAEGETAEGATFAVEIPSPPAPLPRERGDRVDRVRGLMSLPERRAGGASAPVSPPLGPGSIERLLASVDAELPSHLRRLAAASGPAGRGRGVRVGLRVGLFPGHVLVERRSPGGLPEHVALDWRFEGGRLVFGEELVPFEAVAGRLGSWGDLLTSHVREARNDENTKARIEELTERLRETAAERDRLTERLAARGPTSALRRPASVDGVADEAFVRAIRRR